MPPSIQNIPIVTSYKYLGAIVNDKLDFEDHFSTISRKIFFMTNQLTGVRRQAKTHLNLSLFRILIIPQYRIAFSIYSHCDPHQKLQFENHFKRSLKRFLSLPINTADRTIFSLFGNIKEYIETHSNIIKHLTDRYSGQPVGPRPRKPAPRKYFPTSTTKIIQVMYGSICSEHLVINNTEHLTEAHRLMSIRALIDAYTTARRPQRKRINHQCNQLLQAINQLALSQPH